MLAFQAVIDALAERIETAYELRRPGWHGTCSTSRVWSAASARLLEAHESDPSVPLDPELFVASQPIGPMYPDPWQELTQPVALHCYQGRVAAIVRQLHVELAGEVRRAEGLIKAGQPIVLVLNSRNRRLSPLSRFIVAQRAGRAALASRYRREAVAQHRSCPLYRQASAGLLAADSYPVGLEDKPTTLKLPSPNRALLQPHQN